MTCKKWDIILVPFPFSDLTATKKRPALVISPDEFNTGIDVVIAFITSKLDSPYRIGDYQIQAWQNANLPKPSMIRMKFTTLDKSIIIKKLGRLDNRDIAEFVELLKDFVTK
ncbi:type II toxin-antitoxin system PemK/MazF family toxin [candidate division KSB1 bacterium]|nr:type II toxin-antitoxin system PemK/MazF family toxin [candidate division KSB1 bacterium]